MFIVPKTRKLPGTLPAALGIRTAAVQAGQAAFRQHFASTENPRLSVVKMGCQGDLTYLGFKYNPLGQGASTENFSVLSVPAKGLVAAWQEVANCAFIFPPKNNG